MRSLWLALLLLLSAVAGAQGGAGTVEHGTLVHDGVVRRYRLYLPADPAPGGAPLLLALHGRGGDGDGMAALSDFDLLAGAFGFVAVYPDGLDGQWNYARGVPGYPERPDDTAFLLALVDALAGRVAVDRERLYVVGFSNGGFMAQRLACEAGGVFAAFASVAAAGFGGMPTRCPEAEPLSLLLMHGTADVNIPWDGMVREAGVGEVLILASVPLTYGYWAHHVGCSTEATTRELPESGRSPGTVVRVVSAKGCPGGHEVVLYGVLGGGHTWPGAHGRLSAAAGRVNLDIHASQEIWAFFRRHPR